MAKLSEVTVNLVTKVHKVEHVSVAVNRLVIEGNNIFLDGVKQKGVFSYVLNAGVNITPTITIVSNV